MLECLEFNFDHLRFVEAQAQVMADDPEALLETTVVKCSHGLRPDFHSFGGVGYHLVDDRDVYGNGAMKVRN